MEISIQNIATVYYRKARKHSYLQLDNNSGPVSSLDNNSTTKAQKIGTQDLITALEFHADPDDQDFILDYISKKYSRGEFRTKYNLIYGIRERTLTTVLLEVGARLEKNIFG